MLMQEFLEKRKESMRPPFFLFPCAQKPDLKQHVGFPFKSETLKAWGGVKKSCIKGANMELFSTRSFNPGDIITICISPKKTRVDPQSKTYKMESSGFYYSISKNAQLLMSDYFMNDDTCKFKEIDKERLMNNNNAKLSGFRVEAMYRIELGI